MKRTVFFLSLLIAALTSGAWAQEIDLTSCGPQEKVRPAPAALAELGRQQDQAAIEGETWWVIDFRECDQIDKPQIDAESWLVFRELPQGWRGGGVGLIITKSDHRILKAYGSR